MREGPKAQLKFPLKKSVVAEASFKSKKLFCSQMLPSDYQSTISFLFILLGILLKFNKLYLGNNGNEFQKLPYLLQFWKLVLCDVSSYS